MLWGREEEEGNHVSPRFSTRVPETTPTTRTAIRNKPINMLRIPVTVCLRGEGAERYAIHCPLNRSV